MNSPYKPNFDQVIERYRRLWQGQMKDGILCKISVRDGEQPRDSFMCHVPDYRKMYADYLELWETTKRLKDDTLPVIAPCFGDGIFGGFLGGKVSYASETCWSDPFLDDYDNLQSLRYDPENESVRLMKDTFRYYLDRAGDKLAVAAPLIGNPGDTAYVIRGGELLTDFYDRPQDVHALLEVLTKFSIECREDFWRMGGAYEGGVYYMWMNWWITGRAPSLTADVFCLCSREIFREFGTPYFQEQIDHFGSGWFHLHNLGLHLLPEAVKMRKLTGIEISEDPNVKGRSFEAIDWIKSVVGDIPVQINCRPEEFVKGLTDRTLPGNIIYVVCNDNYADIKDMTVDEANRLMEKVRSYRAA